MYCNGWYIIVGSKFTFEQWVSKARVIHGERYTYDKSSYVDSQHKVTIVCRKHGRFAQLAVQHTSRKTGCPRCAAESKADTTRLGVARFIEKSHQRHGDKYDYSGVVEYLSNSQKQNIRCVEHGVFTQSALKHLSGQGCPSCGVAARTSGNMLGTSTFVARAEAIHGDKYLYGNSSPWLGVLNKVSLTCRTHNFVFEQTADAHLAGKGCPKCAKQLSRGEDELFTMMQEHTPVQRRYRPEFMQGLELDIYAPEIKLAVEYNGVYWHSDKFPNATARHLAKTRMAESQGIRLLHIFEDEVALRRSAVDNLLRSAMGVASRSYARKLSLQLVDSVTAKTFLEANHIQGHARGGVAYGLFEGEALRAIMMFGAVKSVRGNKASPGSWELLRYASEGTVVGGASRLFKHFLTQHVVASVISYSERRLFTGQMYETLGFRFVHHTQPSYWVVVNGVRRHKSGFRKSRLRTLFGEKYDNNKSERELCHENGLYRVFDCGLSKWEFLGK